MMPILNPEQWRMLSPYLDEALEMTDTERAAWLDSLRVENPVLAHELETILDEHRALSAEGFLEKPSVGLRRWRSLSKGRLEDAQAALRSAFEHLESAVGTGHPDTRSARLLAETDISHK